MGESTIRDFKKIVEFSFDHKLRRAIMGLGAPGIGKSECMQQICDARGVKLIDLRLLLYSETDLKGIPFPDKETGTTRWLPNRILPNAERDGERGILLVEELTSAPKRVQAAAYQLIQDYRLGEYEVPKGWLIVATGNRQEDNGVYVQMPAPLANRMQIHTIIPKLEIWKQDFAYPVGINPNVIAYLDFKPTALHTQDPEGMEMRFASPRAWKAVSDILNVGGNINDVLVREQIAGNIGDVETSGFYAFMKFESKLPKLENILNGKMKNPPEENQILYMLISGLISHFTEKLKEPDLKMAEDDRTELERTLNFILKMPTEFVALGLRDMISLNPGWMKNFMLVETDSPELLEFLQKNAYLFK